LGKSWEFLLNKHTHYTGKQSRFFPKEIFFVCKIAKNGPLLPNITIPKETRHALFSSMQRKVVTFSSMQRTIKDSLEATLVKNSKIKSLSVKT